MPSVRQTHLEGSTQLAWLKCCVDDPWSRVGESVMAASSSVDPSFRCGSAKPSLSVATAPGFFIGLGAIGLQ